MQICAGDIITPRKVVFLTKYMSYIFSVLGTLIRCQKGSESTEEVVLYNCSVVAVFNDTEDSI